MAKSFAPLLGVTALLCLPALADQDPTARGQALFTGEATPACAICHTLAAAGTSGQIGPNLDELGPTADMVRNAVSRGVGVMPAYADALSSDDIEALVTFVTDATGGD
ncbi:MULTISPECIES: c-type cytochrome [Halomonas]|jgi:cytochrome c6|uniref:SorU family sulfite dehydrogenase c-type cytochrome subunit n=1 Tax=Halomonas TaxID=2745 RepID=UPI0020B86A83|nr:cytochrome c [Halomonas sp. 3H]